MVVGGIDESIAITNHLALTLRCRTQHIKTTGCVVIFVRGLDTSVPVRNWNGRSGQGWEVGLAGADNRLVPGSIENQGWRVEDNQVLFLIYFTLLVGIE